MVARNEELSRLQAQIAEREAALPLRERIRKIFKKYGVTVTAVFLAARVTIGAVVGALTNALKGTLSGPLLFSCLLNFNFILLQGCCYEC